MPSSRQGPGRTNDQRNPGHVARSDAPDRLHVALLPLRGFLGVTLLYAGLDKLVDPAFLHANGPGSIGQQLEAFTHASPLTPLIDVFARPFPVLVGVLIALAEIAIGLGALSGLLYRTAAAGGCALGILFWLTASWTTTPYYYGPDLPYAFGWLTLALAGSGGLYTVGSWFERWTAPPSTVRGRPPATVSQERRALLQAAALAAAAVAVGGMAGVTGRFLRRADNGVVTAGATADPGGAASATAPVGPVAGATPATPDAPANAGSGATAGGAGSSGPVIASLGDVLPRHAYEFQDPVTGDPAILLRLAGDQVVAFDALCTHQGCTVGYDRGSGLLLCPCHGAVFDPAHDGQAVGGPTNIPLAGLPLSIDQATGKISLRA